MACFDIFNGDADGLCALHQLRLHEPRAAELVTGAKRDIRLVERVNASAADELSVLDVSFDVNRAGVMRALAAGARVRYFDHHYAGEIPLQARLETHIDTSAEVCTSLIVDRVIGGRHRAWAVVAAYGDNLGRVAEQAAMPLAIAPHALARLAELGECLNYNAYGDSVEDLYYHPADLYRTLAPYADPFDFLCGEPVLDVLRQGMADDLYRASEIKPHAHGEAHALVMLPDASWSRRVAGVLGNRLAQQHPQRAHAVLTSSPRGYRVSVRAPLADPHGADALCRRFPNGGGRAGAAGIELLAHSELEGFVRAFAEAYPAPA